MNFKPINGNIQPMPMFRILFLIFFTVPLIEIYILFRLSSLLGLAPTLGLCVLTAIAGAGLVRYQGLQTLKAVQGRLAAGEAPAREMLDGVLLLLSGTLLLIPGFLTDCIGLICLIPAVRRALAEHIIDSMVHSKNGTVNNHSVIIEGEYQVEEHERLGH